MPAIQSDWYAIVNPHAGSGKTMDEWSKAEDFLAAKGISYKAVLTTHKYHAKELSYLAAEAGYRKILAVGGDGSVHEVFCGIMQYCDEYGVSPDRFYVAVIPIGSGNDWIKSLNVEHDTAKVVELIAAESFAKQDFVRVMTNKGPCCMANIGGLGFDSHVCERVNEQKDRGLRSKSIYFKSLLLTIKNTKAFKGKVTIDDKLVFEGDVYSIAFGNGRFSGSGMRQTALADVSDGILDVLVVPKAPVYALLTQIPRLFNGKVAESRIVRYFQGTSLKVESDNEQIIEVDGEIEGSLPLTINMSGDQINVLVGN